MTDTDDYNDGKETLSSRQEISVAQSTSGDQTTFVSTQPDRDEINCDVKNVKDTTTNLTSGMSASRNPKSRAQKLKIFGHTRRHPMPALPDCVLKEIELSNAEGVQDAFVRMRDGESVVAVGYCCLMTRAANAFIRLNEDFIRISYTRNRFCFPCLNCFKAARSLDIRDVRIARVGHDGLQHQEDFPVERCFSIVFKGRRHTSYFLAPTGDAANYWVQGINHIQKILQELPPRLHQSLFLWDVFRKADLDKGGNLSISEVEKLFRGKGGFVTREDRRKVLDNFLKSTTNESPHVDFRGFVGFYQTATLLPEFEAIFKEYSANKSYLTATEIHNFIQKSQGENGVTEDDCVKIIEDYELSDEFRTQKQLSIHGFVSFMLSRHCDIFNRRHDEVYQDMEQPLSHYFIASSHNTYLLKDQLRGPSSTDAYMKALLQGCRCVELDCWDGPDSEPEIFHGYTLTSKIKFRDVIEVIYKYAFETSKYPVILSLENHCSVKQQEKMAAYMQEIIGDKLITKDSFTNPNADRLPSPAAMQGKILVKGKKLPAMTSDNEELDDGEVSDEDEAAEMEVNLSHERRGKLGRTLPKRRQHTATSVEDDGMQQNDADDTQKVNLLEESTANSRSPKKILKLSKLLSDQVVYCKSSKFKGIDEALQTTNYNEISSFTESKAYGLACDNREKAVQFHVDHLNRTYPGGTRTDSSNYNPQPLWNAGFQVVALNYQTKCDEMTLYHAKFRQNGRCGYVLKPEFMRSFNDVKADQQPEEMAIKVICGSEIAVSAKGQSSLSVEIEIQGDPRDDEKKRTKSVDGSGYNPVWDEDLSFQISAPSLAMVWIKVYDDDSDNVGQFVLPYSSISKGYRTVHLLDRDGAALKNSHVFIHVTKV